MIRASDFEFRNLWALFGAIFGGSFFLYLFDQVPSGVRLANWIAAAVQGSQPLLVRRVFGVSAGIIVASALLRTWGSAYLGREVVHDHAVHSEALRADGPYRHVRNPLYLGNVLMSFAIAFLAPLMGSAVILIGNAVFCYRLIGREEAALEAEQSERYRAFMRAVPRLWPSVRARIPASGSLPDWINGLASEAFFWSFALGVVGFALSLNVVWFYGGFLFSPVLSWLAGWALQQRRHTTRGPAA